jgi:hypothetical protein
MKLLTFFFALALFSSPAVAGSDDTDTDLCQYLGELAGATMGARQSGIPPSVLMVEPEGDFGTFNNAMVLEAFKAPRYSSEEMVEKAKQDFRSLIEIKCYEDWQDR